MYKAPHNNAWNKWVIDLSATQIIFTLYFMGNVLPSPINQIWCPSRNKNHLEYNYLF